MSLKRPLPALGRFAYRLYLAAGVLLTVLVVMFILFPQLGAAWHTALFVSQVLPSPVKPQPWFTAAPLRQQITYDRLDGLGAADIYYIPDGKRRAALLVFLGANAAGRDDPDVVNFGNALARAGFVVMLGWSPTMGERNNVDPAEIDNLAWAFQHLRSRDYVDPARVGMAGFSVGGSFVMVAAANPRIREDVAFVNSFGGYYDAPDFFRQIASNSQFREDGPPEPWAVDPLTRRVFVNELLEVVPDPAERELLTRRFGNEEIGAGDAAAWDGLSEQGNLSRRILEGTTPEQAAELFDQMSLSFRQGLADISPSVHLPQVQAKLLIMHDVGDPLIPVGESRRLVKALSAQGRHDLRYTETAIFDHVRPGSSGSLWQLAKGAAQLYRHLYGIVRLAG